MKPVLILAMLMSLLVVSCKKSNDEKILSDQLVAAQKVLKWLDAEKERADPDSAKLLELLKQNLLPGELSVENLGNKIEITVPLKDQFKTANLTSLNTMKYFVLTETAGKPARGRVVELIMRERHKAVFRLRDANQEMPGFTGIISSLSVYGKFISEDVYKNGKLYSSSRLISKAKTKKVSDGKKIAEAGIEAENLRLLTCLDWYIITTYYNNDGSVAYVTYEYVGTTCDGFPPPCATDRIITETQSNFRPGCADGGGDGNSGGGGSNQANMNQNIIDSLLGYPCAQAVLNSFKTSLSDSVTSMIKTIFGKTEDLNLIFSVDSKLAGTTIDGYYDKTYWSGNKANYVIKLNPTTLKNSTQEYILGTMLHEGIHAYILNQKNTLDSVSFNAAFPLYGKYYSGQQDHVQMATRFLNSMINALMGYNKNLPYNTARAIALGGLEATDFWQSLPDGLDILKINWAERNVNSFTYGHYTGTKCN